MSGSGESFRPGASVARSAEARGYAGSRGEREAVGGEASPTGGPVRVGHPAGEQGFSSVRDAEAVSHVVGQAVKKARVGAGLTLGKVAGRAGVTPSFLSQVENGRSMPSLLTLHVVAQALGVSAHTFLEGLEVEDAHAISLVRASEGTPYERSEVPGAAMERFLTPGRPGLEAGEVRAIPGSDSGEHVAHEGEELTYVLEGVIEVDLAARGREKLYAGDALSFPATVPHRWAVVGDEHVRFLVVATPASF